jgi:hypothetical protein
MRPRLFQYSITANEKIKSATRKSGEEKQKSRREER